MVVIKIGPKNLPHLSNLQNYRSSDLFVVKQPYIFLLQEYEPFIYIEPQIEPQKLIYLWIQKKNNKEVNFLKAFLGFPHVLQKVAFLDGATTELIH